MSILSKLLKGEITFSAAAAQAAQWAQQVTARDPALTAAAGVLLSAAKQGASDAIMLADTSIGTLIMPAAKGLEEALDAALASATKGASLPLNPITDAFIDQVARTVKATADAWALQAKAGLATNGPASQAQAQAPAQGSTPAPPARAA